MDSRERCGPNDIEKVFDVDVKIDESFWFAVHTRSRHEKVVRDQFGAKRITHLLPLHQKRSVWKDRVKTIEVPLFCGYIFGYFPLQDRLQVLQSVGVVDLVGLTGHPEPVPEDQIEGIRAMIEHRLPYDPYPYLKEGMSVRVKRGPLMGTQGVLIEKKKHFRFVINIDLIQQSVAVDIDSADIEALY